MKILIVNASDIHGGAAKAAYRLHKALLENNIESQMLVLDKSSNDPTVLKVTKLQKIKRKIRLLLDKVPIKFYKNKTKTLFSPAWLPFDKVTKKINEINPDIVHLHWICGSMMSIEDIAHINAPIVWSLHDMWPFTGGCHYDEECGKYKENCGNCKVLRSTNEEDLSRKVFLRKQKIFNQKKDMYIVGLSQWLYDCSKTSALFKDKQHINLPNPIDTKIFKPIDKEKARELWNLPQNKKLVLFGAMNATSDPRKGYKELIEAMQKLEKNSKIEFVVFGSNRPQNATDFGFKAHYLGSLTDDVSLVTLYNAVDVMVVPSLQENLSNVIMESLSCGTPVIAFNIGGNKDMIEHKQNGYLAQPFDTSDLKDGIEWTLNNPNYKKFCHNAREKIIKEFDSKIITTQYIKLYDKVLTEHSWK